jgi:hypothetical protein
MFYDHIDPKTYQKTSDDNGVMTSPNNSSTSARRFQTRSPSYLAAFARPGFISAQAQALGLNAFQLTPSEPRWIRRI